MDDFSDTPSPSDSPSLEWPESPTRQDIFRLCGIVWAKAMQRESAVTLRKQQKVVFVADPDLPTGLRAVELMARSAGLLEQRKGEEPAKQDWEALCSEMRRAGYDVVPVRKS